MTDYAELIGELESCRVQDSLDSAAKLMHRAAAAIRVLTAPEAEISIPFEEIAASYNKHLGVYLSRASQMPANRKAALRAAWRSNKERQALQWWDDLFARCARSDFLSGRRAPGRGHEGWRANFDWLVKPANLTKILEGNYDNRGTSTDVDAITRGR